MPAVCIALTASVLAVVPPTGTQDKLTTRAAREAIVALYAQWGRARVSFDEETIETILDPNFYVLLDGRRISREEFVTMILRKSPDRQLTRFDVDVLTVQQADDGWTAVISEKLEIAITDDDGSIQKAYSFWVTRDGFRRKGDRWFVSFSEAIGYENWRRGERPPFKDW
jgi:hypothetical protein